MTRRLGRLLLIGGSALMAVAVRPPLADAQDRSQPIQLSPEDEFRWRRIAQDSYVVGNLHKALDAWNLVGEPRLEQIDVGGSTRTRPRVIQRLVGLQPGQLITSDAFLRASRRLDTLPVAAETLLQYTPVERGLARIEARIDEHHVVPRGLFGLGAIFGRAIVNRELRVDVAGLTRSGENIDIAWRWQTGWKRLGLGLAVPSPGFLPGLLVVSAFSEKQMYALVPETTTLEARRHFGLGVTDWATGRVRWEAGGVWDRFADRSHAGVEGAVETRLAQDHVSTVAEGNIWRPTGGGSPFGTARMAVAVRSTTTPDVPVLSIVSGVSVASARAPLAVWSGAGSSESPDGPLRAHVLRRSGRMTGEVFGRRLTYTSIEYERPLRSTALGPVSGAIFADLAQASHRFGGLPKTPVHVDTGVGVRLRAGSNGLVRFDLARGLRDGRMKASVGFVQKWPRR